ncbi:MFS transporter [Candidatus Bathyarchaeota archaeon]|nr:MFS transporter [Candidatus Bathyarchaeota archaeon]
MENVKYRPKSTKNVLAVATMSHMTQHLYMGASVLYPSIMASLQLSYSEIGLAVSVGSILAGFLQLMMSILSRYVPRRIILGFGNLLYAAAEYGTGLSRNFIQLFSANLLGGIGQAVQHPIGVSIVSDKYRQGSVGGALGLFYGVAYVGNIVGPIVLAVLATAFGWRSSLYLFALAPAFIGVYLMMHLRGEWSAGKTFKQVSLRKDVSSAIHVKSAVAVILSQSLFAGGTGMGALVIYTPLFLANQIHLSTLDVGAFFSIMMLGGVIGPLLIGRYSDRVGHLEGAIVCTVAAALLVYLLPLHAVSSSSMVLHLFLLGISGFPATSLLQAHLSKVAAPSERDILLGLFFTIGYGFSSVWSAVMGIVIQTYGSFRPAYVLMAALALIGTLPLFYTKLTRGRRATLGLSAR